MIGKLTHSLLLCTIPIYAIDPQPLKTISTSRSNAGQSRYIQQLFTAEGVLSYDAVMELMEQIENDNFEDACSPDDWNQICQFFAYLAKQGMPADADQSQIDCDIQELLASEPDLASAVYYLGNSDAIVCKSWIHKKGKRIKHFVKHHKKACIIGAIVIVATIVVVSAAAAGTAAVATVGAAAAGNDSKPENDEIITLKTVIEENNLISSNTDCETARTIGSTLTHEAISTIYGHGIADTAFSTDQSIHYLNQTPSFEDLNSRFGKNVYFRQGEQALKEGNFNIALDHFDKAIAIDPANPDGYLHRAITHLELHDYESSLNDYQTYTANQPRQVHSSPVEFCIGFGHGLPKGAAESGHQLVAFASDAITHPIDTTCNVCSAFATLAKLTATQEWAALSQSLAPEVCELAEQWNTLTPREQGDKTGYIFGKYGGDILIPGATAKVLAKGIEGAKELALVAKNLQTAEKTLALEGLAESASKQSLFNDVSSFYRNLSTSNNPSIIESIPKLQKGAKISEIVRLENMISEWLGDEAKLIRNEAGDSIFISKDGMKCVRFDFNNPAPHKNPHAHVEVKINGKWEKSGQIYPIDVSNN